MSDFDPQVGEPIRAVSIDADEAMLFCYSAMTWNPHRVHYDTPYTVEKEGYPGLLVQGPLLGGLLLRCTHEWLAGRGRVVATRYRSSAPTYVGAEVRCAGAVTERHAQRLVVTLEISIPDGTITCSGTVEVELDG